MWAVPVSRFRLPGVCAGRQEHTTQEEATGLGVRSDTLEKCESVADAVGGCSG